MQNFKFDDALDRVFVVYDSEQKGVMVTQLMDEDSGCRYSVETAGMTTKLRKWVPHQGRAHVVATYRSSSKENARKKHWGVVGLVQREAANV